MSLSGQFVHKLANVFIPSIPVVYFLSVLIAMKKQGWDIRTSYSDIVFGSGRQFGNLQSMQAKRMKLPLRNIFPAF